ncbi:cytochrome p450, partial [Trifolium pratense]
MVENKSVVEQLPEFNKIIDNLANIDVNLEDEDKAFHLLCALPKSLENLKDALLYVKEGTITLDEVQSALRTKEWKKLRDLRVDDGAEGLNAARGLLDVVGCKEILILRLVEPPKIPRLVGGKQIFKSNWRQAISGVRRGRLWGPKRDGVILWCKHDEHNAGREIILRGAPFLCCVVGSAAVDHAGRGTSHARRGTAVQKENQKQGICTLISLPLKNSPSEAKLLQKISFDL